MTNDTSHSTNQQKRTVGIFFGGKSAEHEISISSAKNVLEALDTSKYAPVLVGIDKKGGWHNVATIDLSNNPVPQTITDAPERNQFDVSGIDVALPILHGPMGEDGTIQGFFELAGVPYVGTGVLASAACMDKDVTKRLLRDAGIATAPFVTVTIDEQNDLSVEAIVAELGNTLFVKPANMGSSVGVSKVTSTDELLAAVTEAFKYDSKILIESAIVGDEIECAVLGNQQPKASVIGRIVPKDNFYSYDAKYIDDDGAVLEIPAKIADAASDAARDVAVKTYKVLGCEGMSRVDMFVTREGKIVVNEINTIPGFTKISMYPKMWEATGLPYSELISELITLAIDRFERRSHVQVSH